MSAMPHANDYSPLPYYKAARRRLQAVRREAQQKQVVAMRGFTFRGAALQFIERPWNEAIIDGPTGTGKTVAGLFKLHQRCSSSRGVRALLLRKTRASLTTTGLVTLEDVVLGADHPMVADGPTRSTRHSYVYPNGSELVVGGMDKASRVLSSDYDIILVLQAEELTEDDWETLSTRCRHYAVPEQELLGDCNPSHPSHWIKRRSETGQTPLLHSRHEDNPKLHDGHDWTPQGRVYMDRLDRLTGVRRERFRLGHWAAAEGMVFGDVWNAAVHIIEPFPIPRSWRRFMAVDFGYTNPFVCGWWALDPDGRMYLYRQLYMSRRTVRAHAEQINRINCAATVEEWDALTAGERLSRVARAGRPRVEQPEGDEGYYPGEHIEACVCDHDAEDRATMREHGIPTKAAHKAVKFGIEQVTERLRVQGDGRARLYIFRDSLIEADDALREAGLPWATEQEVDSYVYPKGADGKPNKELPVQVNDHGLDMTRYAACYAKRSGGMWVEVL